MLTRLAVACVAPAIAVGDAHSQPGRAGQPAPDGYEDCTGGGHIALSVALADAATGRGVPWRLVPLARAQWWAGRSTGVASHMPNFGPGGDYPTEGTADGEGFGVVWGRPGTYRVRVRVPGYRPWDTAGVRVSQGTEHPAHVAPAHCGTGEPASVVARLRPDPAEARAFAAAAAAAAADTLPSSLRRAFVVGGLAVRAAARLEPGGDPGRFVRLDSLRQPHPDTAGPVLRVATTIANRGADTAIVHLFACGVDVVLYPADAAPPARPTRAPRVPRVPPAWRSVGGAETRTRVGRPGQSVGCPGDPVRRRVPPRARLTPGELVARVPAAWVLEDVAAARGAPPPAVYVVAVRPRFGLGPVGPGEESAPGAPADVRVVVDGPGSAWLHAGSVRLAPPSSR